MGPITNAIYSAIKPHGVLVHEGFIVKCADGHLIATLDDHLPGTQAHSWFNQEFTDDLWVIDPEQSKIDWSNPVCYCGKPLAP